MDHPKSGLPDFGHFKCASRINPTCEDKPAGDTGGWFASERSKPSRATLPSARLESAAHAGAAGGRARARAIGLGFPLRAHFIERRLARTARLTGLPPHC